MNEFPDPLTPAEADLQGYGFMPFYGHRLFGSDFNARCNDAEWRAGVTLWWAAWNQVPAGSLPDDDTALCRLADLGRDVKAWRKLRTNALHGFVKCSDGRLYHKALSPLVIEAWDRRVAERDRKRKWREKKAGQNPDVPVLSPSPEHGPDADVPAERTGEDRTGQDSERTGDSKNIKKPLVKVPREVAREGGPNFKDPEVRWQRHEQKVCNEIKATNSADGYAAWLAAYWANDPQAKRLFNEVSSQLKASKQHG